LKSLTKTGDKVKILYQVVDGCLPAFRHAHKNDAGYDLYSTENAWIRSGETRAIMTNARVCIPAGICGACDRQE
jgi:dUTPase